MTYASGRFRWTWTAIASLLTACGGPGDLLVAPTSGALHVHTTAQGEAIDPDGFALSLDGAPAVPIRANGSYLWADLAPSGYSVLLSGLANNCGVSGSSVRSVQVAAGDTTQIWFDVTCLGPASLFIQVSTQALFGWKDPDGYDVAVDGVVRKRISDAGSVVVSGIAEGEHSVGLSDIALGCSYSGSQTVAVPAYGTVTVKFTVGCLAPGIP